MCPPPPVKDIGQNILVLIAYYLTSASSDCQTGDGKDYKGEIDKTVSGKDCQDWTEQKPHEHNFKEVG